ncbi:MAG TPA: DUF4349 domain-containing protein [Streptosporangiaceae bacterium]|nr:DUF4349 domain-containing protein [Streptosporangiaceae bacterium]
MGAPRFTRTTSTLLAVLAGLLAAGCSAAGHAASPSSGASMPRAAALPARGAPGPSTASGSAALTDLAGTQSIIYTASLTVRAASVTRAAAGATQLARVAGGYVSAENTALSRAHPGRSTVSLQLKIPVAGYQRVLGALAGLGTRQAESQHAEDVTQTVADVTSRVASAQAAITQLRKLLARAGSVSSLLSVQNQINAEEASLEALQAQQRALAHQTAFATISLLLVAKPVPGVKKHAQSGGFLRGLAAGWHGLSRVVAALLTAAGAALPFAVILAAAGYLGWRGRRWMRRHRSAASAAGPTSPGSAATE